MEKENKNINKNKKNPKTLVHGSCPVGSWVSGPSLYHTSGCQRDSVQRMARETAPSWISPLQGSGWCGLLTVVKWDSEDGKIKSKISVPQPFLPLLHNFSAVLRRHFLQFHCGYRIKALSNYEIDWLRFFRETQGEGRSLHRLQVMTAKRNQLCFGCIQ